MKRMFIPVAVLVLAALALAAPAVQAKGGPGTRIALKSTGAFPGASGKAKFQNEGQRELEIEVERGVHLGRDHAPRSPSRRQRCRPS